MKKTRIFALLLVLMVAFALLVSCGECAHEYDGGSCTKCGEADPNYVAPCEHDFKNGGCTKCNKACICEFKDGVCKICGDTDPDYVPPCEHVFENGECTKCHEDCKCVFANGACVFCGKACECNFENGACTVCGKACECNFEMGACTVCGKACKCIYVNGICVICGGACNCNFENGACTVCGKACECTFEMGACTVCGKACDCEFELGVCTVCGATDPNYTGREIYDEMVEKFKYLVKYVDSNYDLPAKEEDSTVPNYDVLYDVAKYHSPTEGLGYSYKDIDDDGLDELFLIGPDRRIYALFTIADNAPVLVQTFQNGLGYLHNGKNVFYAVKIFDEETGEQTDSLLNYTSLIDGKLVGFTYGRGKNPAGEDIYFQIQDGKFQPISREEHRLYSSFIFEGLWSYATRVSSKSNLVYYPAVDSGSSPKYTADFSSYDAIVKTYGLMYSVVAGGKYQASKFSSGKYENGLVINSEEDFVIYNRLLSACTLSYAGAQPTFGYAKRDLNGDGVEELVLLEGSKYSVLAIFTEVDGKPVLLDSYNDLRAAFIDADGLIHVYERILPGSPSDREYTVYAIEDGKLAVKVCFGVKYDVKSVPEYNAAPSWYQSAWYKIVDGEAVDIDKIAYETLLETYFSVNGEINAENCAKYNLNNSGLEFVLATAQE